MKLQPLYDLQQEINRLFIAGSKFSKGDPRLQKHIPVLNKLGEKAPVFAKLAKDIEELLDTDTQQSAGKLMAVSTLLYSVLYTQGDMVEADVEESIQSPNIPLEEINTEYSYLQLKPVMQALTTSNSGRIEILKDALERNIFNDSRTYRYLDFALGDKYAELCDYVEKVIIPKAGKPVIPFLIQNFKYEDKTENVRRLRLLHKFNLPQLPGMMDKILSESLPGLQAECINILSEDIKNEALIIKLADDKNKQVREAAYMGLVKLGTRNSFEKLKDIYTNNKNKANLPAIVSALASSKLPFFFQEVFNQVVGSFEEFVALDKTADDKVLADKLERFRINLDVLESIEKPESLEFYERVLKDDQYNNLILAKKSLLENTAGGITYAIISSLRAFPKSTVIDFYERNIDGVRKNIWAGPLWNNYFYVAAKSNSYTKEKVFDLFSPRFGKEITIGTLYNIYTDDNSNYDYYYDDKHVEVFSDKIDLRWIDLLYKEFEGNIKWRNEHRKVLRIIDACQPDNKRMDELLILLLRKTMPGEHPTLFKLMMKRKTKDRFEAIHSIMLAFAPKTYNHALYQLRDIGFWKQFPKEYAVKYRAIYETSKLDIFNEVADEIENQ